jgi:hypothetical protein
MRASDAEREQVAEVLRKAVTDGRLSLAEGDERLAQAYATKYRDELGPLTVDLPEEGRPPARPAPEMVAMVRRRLRRHTSFVLVLSGLLVTVWLLSGAHFFWPVFPLLFLTFGLLRHWRFAHSPWAMYRHPGHGRSGWAGTDGDSGGAERGVPGWDGGDWRGGPPRGRGRW